MWFKGRAVQNPVQLIDGKNDPIDPDLSSVIESWDSLLTKTRAAILAIVEAAGGR